jgi:hypothetical protein
VDAAIQATLKVRPFVIDLAIAEIDDVFLTAQNAILLIP